jgi:hypothetical protein
VAVTDARQVREQLRFGRCDSLVDLHRELDHVFTADAVDQLRRRPNGDCLSPIYNHYAIAKALGFPGHALGQITVRAEGPVHVPMFRTAAMGMAEGAVPGPVPIEAGKSAVTVFVSGSVVLGPPK